MSEIYMQYKIFEALDRMQGIEAAVAHRRFLGNYSHEQISAELDISSQDAARIAAAGLRYIKDYVYGI